ncbi:17-beta-hydroxysteroid dehydrogenase 13 [Orchesella cincta]|uniref:Short-chain dehydrogenase/reductase 3 n=1 Tax=Orchesella cincta TaxID=48709 RepID=A0A1D2MLZ6_ORCCI|nr:17-beta-hydroxysteroid dehydrogenase 13 [Orchesella cincta]
MTEVRIRRGLMFWLVAAKDVVLLYFYTLFVFLESFFQSVFPPRLKSLKDEIILVTGSASGIGRMICLELASTGAKLVCWDINKWDNDGLVKELRNLGATAYGYEVDVSDRQKVRTAAEQVKTDVGDITMIINNAGIMPCHSFLSHNPKEISRAFEVNVLSQMWVVREFLPRMIERKCGHIVAICSMAGLIGSRNLSVYSSTKFAVNGFMEALQDELAHLPEGLHIKFTTVYPTSCDTSFSKNIVHTRRDPQLVAKKTVEGIRRNKESICIPPTIVIFGFFLKSLPSKVFHAGRELMGIYSEPRPAATR